MLSYEERLAHIRASMPAPKRRTSFFIPEVGTWRLVAFQCAVAGVLFVLMGVMAAQGHIAATGILLGLAIWHAYWTFNCPKPGERV